MRLVMLHGFTQSPLAWDPVRRHLPRVAGGVPIEALAPEVPDGLDFAATAHAVVEAGGAGVYCGYSMGGRLCLRGALDRPELVRGLVLVSASPGIEDDAARAERVGHDADLAAEARTLGVEAFLRRWLDQPLFSTLEMDPGEVARRARATNVRRLEHQLVVLGQGAQEPLWARLSELRMPVTVVTGRADQTYEAIGDAVASRIPGATRVRLDGGHALALEQPAEVAKVLIDMVRHVSAHGDAS
ncbi:MAG: alpha/beta fold hydrolase [Acidimicrobiales bacterium]|nr:alpha/beta fold hydrolase [Acidimicrobiales bacterium]